VLGSGPGARRDVPPPRPRPGRSRRPHGRYPGAVFSRSRMPGPARRNSVPWPPAPEPARRPAGDHRRLASVSPAPRQPGPPASHGPGQSCRRAGRPAASAAPGTKLLTPRSTSVYLIRQWMAIRENKQSAEHATSPRLSRCRRTGLASTGISPLSWPHDFPDPGRFPTFACSSPPRTRPQLSDQPLCVAAHDGV
jgi:hypothetical protein